MNFFSNSNQKPNNGYHKQHTPKQMHAHKYASREIQKQKVVQMRVFVSQIESIYTSVLTLIQIAAKFDDSMANMATDLAINSLNNFGKACYQLRQEKNSDALDLGKKTIYDKWEKLERKDPVTFKKSLKYRNFMIKALNSKHLMSYNFERVLSEKDAKRQNECINNDELVLSAYTKMIGHHNKFNRKVDSYHNDNTNQKLKQQHEKEINEFRKNKKYQQQNKIHSNMKRPAINSMYLTDSGRNSQFKMDAEEKDELDGILNGHGGDGARDNCNNVYWSNGIIGVSKQQPITLNGVSIAIPVPVQVEIDENIKEKDVHKYKCKLPNPWRVKNKNHDNIVYINPQQFSVVINRNNDKKVMQKILKYEKKWTAQYDNMPLGYSYVNGENDEMMNEITCGMAAVSAVDVDVDNRKVLIMFDKGFTLKGFPQHYKEFPCRIISQGNDSYYVQLAEPYQNNTLQVPATQIKFIQSNVSAMQVD